MRPDVLRLFNRAVEGLPFCYPVDERRLSLALRGQLAAEKGSKSLVAQRAVVAMDGRHMRGLAHWGSKNRDGSSEGVIRFLWFTPGHRAAGEALLAAAEDRLHKRGARVIRVCPCEYTYPCYHIWRAHLTDRIGHVVGLLGLEGYERTRGEVFLSLPGMRVPRSAEPTERVTLRVRLGKGTESLPSIRVTAHADGLEVGSCDSVGLASRTPASEARDWIFTTWLGVDEGHEGKGIGRALLTRALAEARSIGYRRATISTAWDNHRALILYAGLGYRVADWTYEFSREVRSAGNR
jgi:GNAT superfamily N-acetyltransferase